MRFEDWFYSTDNPTPPIQEFLKICETNSVDYTIVEFIKKTYIEGYRAGIKNKAHNQMRSPQQYVMLDGSTKDDKLLAIKSSIISNLEKKKDI